MVLEIMMLSIGIPELFVKCVMTCVTFVSYSMVINGKLGKPFLANKGIR